MNLVKHAAISLAVTMVGMAIVFRVKALRDIVIPGTPSA